jgi:hypothetical protein
VGIELFTASIWSCTLQLILRGDQLLISIDCVFHASLVPETCPARFLDLKGLINRFLESRITGQVPIIGMKRLCGKRKDILGVLSATRRLSSVDF